MPDACFGYNKVFAHNSTLRLVVGAVVLGALRSPILLPDSECSMTRLILQNEAMLEVWLYVSSQEPPRFRDLKPSTSLSCGLWQHCA